jgi:hypothetical protein
MAADDGVVSKEKKKKGTRKERREEARKAGKKGEGDDEGEDGEGEAGPAVPEIDPVVELQSQCRTKMARNIVRNVFKPDMPKYNELFFPGRMAYVIDLEEDVAEVITDIPTTTIRCAIN